MGWRKKGRGMLKGQSQGPDLMSKPPRTVYPNPQAPTHGMHSRRGRALQSLIPSCFPLLPSFRQKRELHPQTRKRGWGVELHTLTYGTTASCPSTLTHTAKAHSGTVRQESPSTTRAPQLRTHSLESAPPARMLAQLSPDTHAFTCRSSHALLPGLNKEHSLQCFQWACTRKHTRVEHTHTESTPSCTPSLVLIHARTPHWHLPHA